MDGARTSTLTTKGWSLSSLLSLGKRFRPVPRISASDPALQARLDDYETGGEPLVVQSFHEHEAWPTHMFTVDYFRQHIDQTSIGVRDIHSLADHIVTFDDFIGHYKDCRPFITPGETKRWYGKDVQCPTEWCQWLHSGALPSRLTPESPQNLLNCLPEDARVETLMCYLGIGDTFTPAHKDLCASFGQNLMTYTENDGCSFWFMTRSADIGEVTKYFHHLGHELDHELHAVTLKELSEAPFDVYIVQQKLGDLVLVPPRSCHQVVNYGGITLKTSWSRMTLSGLSVALAHELPIYQRACRLETYRIKLVVYHALRRFTDSLTSTNSEDDASIVFALIPLYDHILKLESPPAQITSLTLLRAPVSDLTCDFCGADIFQSFFECRQCILPVQSGTSGDCGDGLTLCPACYVDGRQCLCLVMQPMQVRNFDDLLCDRRNALEALKKYSSYRSKPLLYMQSEGSLLLVSHQNVFQAGCILQSWRQKVVDDSRRDLETASRPKMCTMRGTKESNHAIERTACLSCKGCHYSRCFLHILQHYHVHAVEAILDHHCDVTHAVYHSLHKNSAIRYKDNLQCVTRAISDGSFIDLHLLSIYNAHAFTAPRPVNPDLTRLGWYDDPAKILMEIRKVAWPRGNGIITAIDSRDDTTITRPNVSKLNQSASGCTTQSSQTSKGSKRVCGLSVSVPTLESLRLRRASFARLNMNAAVSNVQPPSKVSHHPARQAPRPTTSASSITTKHVPVVAHVKRPSKALQHSVHQARGIPSASSISLAHRSSTSSTSHKHSFTSGSARPLQHKPAVLTPSTAQRSSYSDSKVPDRFPRAHEGEGRSATGQPICSKNRSVFGPRPRGQPQAKATTSLAVSSSQDKGNSRHDKQPATREAISGWHNIFDTTPRKRNATTKESDSEVEASVCSSEDSAPPPKRRKYAGLKFKKTVPPTPSTSAASSPSPKPPPLALPPVPLPATSPPEKTNTREDSGLFAPVEEILSRSNIASLPPQNALEQLLKDPSTSQLLGQFVADVLKVAMQGITTNIAQELKDKNDKPPKYPYQNYRNQPQHSQPPWRKQNSSHHRWGGGASYPPHAQPQFALPGQFEQQWVYFPDVAGPSRYPHEAPQREDGYEQDTDVFVVEQGQMSLEYALSAPPSKSTNTVVNTVRANSDISIPTIQPPRIHDVAEEWGRNVEDILADAEKDDFDYSS